MRYCKIAKDLYSKALSETKKISSSPSKAESDILTELCKCCLLMQDTELAYETGKITRIIHQKNRNMRECSETEKCLGNVCIALGKMRRASIHFKEALHITLQIEDDSDSNKINIASIYYELANITTNNLNEMKRNCEDNLAFIGKYSNQNNLNLMALKYSVLSGLLQCYELKNDKSEDDLMKDCLLQKNLVEYQLGLKSEILSKPKKSDCYFENLEKRFKPKL